jgi:hypothetical protein
MKRESDDRGLAEGAGRDTCAANIAVVRRIFEAVETRSDPKDFAARWAAYVAVYDPNVVTTRHQASHMAATTRATTPWRGTPNGSARHGRACNRPMTGDLSRTS